jgi:hypothetical protein
MPHFALQPRITRRVGCAAMCGDAAPLLAWFAHAYPDPYVDHDALTVCLHRWGSVTRESRDGIVPSGDLRGDAP